jgi:ElaA protein
MSPIISVKWSCLRLSEMSAQRVHELLKTRQEVFILEQRCLYPDIDEIDISCFHMMGYNINQKLIAYCRLIESGAVFNEPTIGRVLIIKQYREMGLARRLMLEAHKYCETVIGSKEVRLNAQLYLQKFYEDIGYQCVSNPYDDDGIMHIEMLRTG